MAGMYCYVQTIFRVVHGTVSIHVMSVSRIIMFTVRS